MSILAQSPHTSETIGLGHFWLDTLVECDEKASNPGERSNNSNNNNQKQLQPTTTL